METRGFFFVVFLEKQWAPQHGGATIDRACVFCAEGNSVAGFPLAAKSFTSPLGSQNTKRVYIHSAFIKKSFYSILLK